MEEKPERQDDSGREQKKVDKERPDGIGFRDSPYDEQVEQDSYDGGCREEAPSNYQRQALIHLL